MIYSKRNFLIFFIFLILALGLFFIWQQTGRTIKIDKPSAEIPDESVLSSKENSPLSGLACSNYQRRPMAVVLAEDAAARPLSGLQQADLILEMPVITGSITRLIAVYVCYWPEEIGSLRSARHDFIPLVMGLDGILAHWGGSHFALDKLDAGIMDNIDAMENPYNAFYQKKEIPMPHNGFTSMERLAKAAEKLGYRLENKFEGYSHQPALTDRQTLTAKTLKIGYAYPYNVEYRYNPETNSYLRWRADRMEIDKNNQQQIEAKNIIVMRAFSRQIEGPYYNDLDIEGKGECQIYQNGQVIPCVWQKDKNNPASKLYFLDNNKQEIAFVPGQIWIEIVEPNQEISWF